MILKKYTGKHFLLFFVVSLTAYWFANAVLWIPWKMNQSLGIVCMILLVPFLWGVSSLYCLKRTPVETWKQSKYVIAAVFLVVAFISDYFFFAIWRGIPDELYRPTTFAAYALILIMPVIIGIVLARRKNKKQTLISNSSLIIIGILGAIFIAFTLYSVQYW